MADEMRFLEDVRDVLRDQGHPLPADAVDRLIERVTAETATVVVVGEQKRGKSSLINALIEWDALLPVETEIATSVHLAVQYRAQAGAVVFDDEHPGGREIGLAEIREYASLDPETQKPIRPGVRCVDVFLPARLLREGLTLVDTPGVGGLVAGHTSITLATLARADILLFVVDASRAMTESELQFLTRAAERIPQVVFALTKIDLFKDSATVKQENLARIRAYAPRFASASWFSVSSRRRQDAIAAEAAGDAELARHRYTSSGFGQLEEALLAIVADRARDVRREAVDQARILISGAVTDAANHLRAYREDRSLVSDLERQRDRLKHVAWRVELERAHREEAVGLLDRMAARLDQVRQAKEELIARGGPDLRAEIMTHLDSATEGLLIELEDDLVTRLAAIAGRTTSGVMTDVGDLPLGDLVLPKLPMDVNEPPRGLMGMLARTRPFADLGSLAISVAALLNPLIASFVGVAMLAFVERLGKQEQKRRLAQLDARHYMERYLDVLNQQFGQLINEAIAASENGLITHMEESLGQADSQLTELIKERGDADRMTRQTLLGKRREAEKRLAELNALRARGDSLADE
ncbi:dynamin [Acrocarpospora pleiomorpha]|uniref:Dynamin n=1 Tax=Acrocarpospora pleiomorpha TaxID=90975 RepID=A0A5M3Y328_9ACTN|nr:dynamin family protein [Acrocarpospora pleiomorpha]GES26293.1 dynamin [Acrocarpospora pleiomorpha]